MGARQRRDSVNPARRATGWAFLPLRNGFMRRLFRLRPLEPLPYRVSPRRIYILPTRQGMVFGLLLMGMLLGAVNYGLSMGFLFTFMLAGMLLGALLATWRTLINLEVLRVDGTPGFAGEPVYFRFKVLQPGTRPASGLWLDAPETAPARVGLNGEVTLSLVATRRGPLKLGPCRLYTEAPLGLFRAWTIFAPDCTVWVWPRPTRQSPPLPAPAGGRESTHDAQRGGTQQGSEDFDGLKDYSPGESLARVAWKSLARRDDDTPPQLKRFIGDPAGELWLDWAATPQLDQEARLSLLARWVLMAEQGQQPYALRLPAERVASGHGPQHRVRCLNALARHGYRAGGMP